MSWSEAPPPDYSDFQGWTQGNGINQHNGAHSYNNSHGLVTPSQSPPTGSASEMAQERPLKGRPTMPLAIRNTTPAPQYEAYHEDIRPSTSLPRRLPALPNSALSVIQPIANEENTYPRHNRGASYNGPVESVPPAQSHQTRYPPPSHPPPGFPGSLVLVTSPERIEVDLPPTPSTHYSTSSQHVSRRSIHSITSANPLSAASYTTADPPPWVVLPNLPRERTITQANVESNESTPRNRPGIPVNFSTDSGHIVSNSYMSLYTDKGDKHRYPAYGKGELIKGYVELKKKKHISEVTITLQGHLTVTYTERGMAHDQKDVRLFTMTKTLYTSQYNESAKDVLQFEFRFPQTCEASEAPLPPTWTLMQPGVSAEVSYTLRADLKRTIRLNEKLSTKVEYYPRNAPPPLPSPWIGPKRVAFEIDANLRPMGRVAIDNPMVPTPFHAEFILEKPLIYPSGSIIPYTIELSSPMHTVPPSLEVVVSLVKVAEVTLHGKTYIKEYQIMDAVNTGRDFLQHRRDRSGAVQEGGTMNIKGSCQAGIEGCERSWKVEKVACIKYLLRFLVRPTSDVAKFDTLRDSLPSFKHSVEIELTTDSMANLSSAEEAGTAAIGLSYQRSRSETMLSGRSSHGSDPTSPVEGLSELGGFGSLPSRNRMNTGRPTTADASLFGRP